jgi:hypothetical protein
MSVFPDSRPIVPLIVCERGDQWSLRLLGDVFPVLEARRPDVVEYIQRNFTGKGVVEVHKETGTVERLKVSALRAI